MKYVRPRKTKEEKIFLKLIDKYNENKDWNNHHINLGNGKLMEITFHNSWSYSIYKLEEI